MRWLSLLSLKDEEILTSMKEILHYMRHVSSVWDRILGDVPKAAVDEVTVSNLQTLAPARSSEDLNQVKSLIDLKMIFPTISDSTRRNALLSNISGVSCLIPSLWTLFENLKYLKPCCTALKKLSGASGKKTIRHALADSYHCPPQLIVEHAENDRSFEQPISFGEDKRLGYLQLWLYAMRHYPQLTGEMPHAEHGKRKPQTEEINPECWSRFGRLAVSLRFRTKHALDLQHAELTPEDGYAMQIADILKKARQSSLGNPRLREIERVGSDRRRTGLPFPNSHWADRGALFLPSIYGEMAGTGNSITSFFVKRDMFHSFFGVDGTEDRAVTSDRGLYRCCSARGWKGLAE